MYDPVVNARQRKPYTKKKAPHSFCLSRIISQNGVSMKVYIVQQGKVEGRIFVCVQAM